MRIIAPRRTINNKKPAIKAGFLHFIAPYWIMFWWGGGNRIIAIIYFANIGIAAIEAFDPIVGIWLILVSASVKLVFLAVRIIRIVAPIVDKIPIGDGVVICFVVACVFIADYWRNVGAALNAHIAKIP